MKRILRQRGWTKRAKQFAVVVGILIVASGIGLGFAELKANIAATPPKAAIIGQKPPKPHTTSKVPDSLARPSHQPPLPAPTKRKLVPTRKTKPKNKVKIKPIMAVTLTPANDKAPKPNAISGISPPPPTQAQIELKIGNSFADVYLDGTKIRRDFMRGAIKLSPGRHELQIVKPGMGSYEPRVLKVGNNGKVFEIQTSGEERPILGTMLFPIPKNNGTPLPANWRQATNDNP